MRRIALAVSGIAFVAGILLWTGRIPLPFALGGAEESLLRATGTIEIQEVTLAPKIGGYVAEMRFREGDVVRAGDIVATLLREDLDADVSRDRAALDRGRALLADLARGERSQRIREASASVASAVSRLRQAERDYGRYRRLYEENAVSRKQMDDVALALDVARNAYVASRENRSLLEAGSREDQIDAQRREVERLDAMLLASMIRREDRVIRSPLGAVVLVRAMEPGELANPGSALVVLGDESDCWVRVYLPSTMLGKIRRGGEAEVRVDSFPGRVFPACVGEIAEKAEFTPRESLTPEERANLVFRVKVRVDNAGGFLRPGMPADVTFR
jgi:HlyD family secretion protein